MIKKIFVNFIKDNLGYIFSFYLSIIILIIYYKLTVHISEIFYPLLLVSTVFIIYMVIEWLKYYNFNINVQDSENLEMNKIFQITNQQRCFYDILKTTQKKYQMKLSRTNSEEIAFRYFFSQWVHNMKTPVSIISLALQKFESEHLDTHDMPLAIFAMEIKEENDKLHNGLEQLLNILRMNEFVRDYEPESVDLVDSLKEIINFKKSLFIYNKVFPQIEHKEDNIKVLTDKKWNKFMLEQIINNAVKYSAIKGENKNIKFIIEKTDKCVNLKIVDEGVGIPKSDINRVFEPFFTGENGRKYRDASGIGLYISSLLAKNLKHKIEIQSEKNLGTTVTITYLIDY
ncbi:MULTISPECIES: sensor histidine kinase [Clostridium]|uniref:histidine kinase n=1 Tax=Clostridium frigoriphilum TaxID=443253 RepID=A0ABU7UV71_9CLOT|nr:sensor histidine kinase [Clostridium sp. DSM 17811]MBU3102342.1 sensor histidine kinase [Clostridium sp. DSM 17811]